MQSKTQKIFIQFIIIIPLLVFLLFYTNEWTYKSLALGVFGLLGINVYRIMRHKSIFSLPLLSILITSFFLYAFYGLGTTNTPQTFYSLKEDSKVAHFDFSKEVQIDEICYYVGIDKNVNFVLESLKNGRWQKFYTYEKSYPYSFRWKCIKSRLKTSQILLRVTKNEMMLNEIRFNYQHHHVSYKTNIKYINDEPQTKIDTSYYSGMFFDEIYFGRTAYEIMHKQNVYENTHPYLGKMLIIPGIKIFGMTPFGWRFMNALFAGLLIYMMYYFALHLFKKHYYALGTAFLTTYSFMHLAQARIGLIDTFGVVFVIISYFYLYRFIVKQQLSRLITSGVFFGLAAAVKWAAVFSALGFILIAFYLLISKYPLQKRFSGYKLLLYGLLSYGLVACLVYAFSFFDIYMQTGSVQSIINYNTNMYHYHSTLQATHPYSSSWWTWPLDWKPMGYYKELKDGVLQSINALGNPAIFWMGIVAVFYLLYKNIREMTLESAFILLAFLGLYLPYIFIGRLMFIYHFYYAVPFFILSIIYMFKDGIEKFDFMRILYTIYLMAIVGLFLMFYPILSGYAIENSYVTHWLKWFSTWWF